MQNVNEGRVIVAVGERPDGLGDRWQTRDWMPAIDVIREHLAREVAAWGALTVVVVPDEGFGLMAGCAALLMRDEGLPVQLVLMVPHRGHAADLATATGRAWFEKMAKRADLTFMVSDQLFVSPDALEGVRYLAYERALEKADEVLACWAGSKRGALWVVMTGAAALGFHPTNLYDRVAVALGIRKPRKRPEPKPDTWGGFYGTRMDGEPRAYRLKAAVDAGTTVATGRERPGWKWGGPKYGTEPRAPIRQPEKWPDR